MNPKVIKLREEREKNVKKIASLQARNKKIDADIISIENTDIIGMVCEYGSMKLHSCSSKRASICHSNFPWQFHFLFAALAIL